MEEKWDDSSDKIMDIIEGIEGNEKLQIPMKCPLCDTYEAHVYMHRWGNGRGTIWAWCSNCKSCMHVSRAELPSWWENADFIDISELTSHPVFLELNVNVIDRHLRKLLEKRNLICK